MCSSLLLYGEVEKGKSGEGQQATTNLKMGMLNLPKEQRSISTKLIQNHWKSISFKVCWGTEFPSSFFIVQKNEYFNCDMVVLIQKRKPKNARREMI